MHYLLFVILALAWGSGFYLMKLAGFAFGPFTIAATSTLGGSVFLWLFWLVNRVRWKVRKRHLVPLVIVAVFAFIYPYVAQPFLVGLIGHGFIGMMVSLVPVLTILASIPLLGLFPSKVQLFGVLMGMMGIVLMFVDGLDRNAEPLYLVMAVSVPVCYAFTNTLIRKKLRDIPPIVLAAIFMTAATIVLTPVSLALEEVRIDERFVTAVVATILLSIFARGLGMLLFYRLIQTKGPLFAGLVTYVIPVEALMWSWYDDERITVMQMLAITVVLLMVGVVQRDIIRKDGGSGS